MKQKGAMELTIGTMVILVLGVVMLILGIVLVTNIMGGATNSVDDINNKVRGEIAALFSDEHSDVVVKLGASKTAEIKDRDTTFNIAIGARTKDDSSLNSSTQLKYNLELDEDSDRNCLRVLGDANTRGLFRTPLDRYIGFDKSSGSQAFALVEVNIPKGTAECTQKVRFTVIDTAKNNEVIGGSFFKIDIVKGAFLFG